MRTRANSQSQEPVPRVKAKYQYVKDKNNQRELRQEESCKGDALVGCKEISEKGEKLLKKAEEREKSEPRVQVRR